MRFATKLVLLLIATLACIQLGTGTTIYAFLRQILIQDGKAQMSETGALLHRQLREIEAQVTAGVHLLTMDYALRQAIAEHEHATVISALRNHGRRIGASRMLLIETDGTVSADVVTAASVNLVPLAEPALRDPAVLDRAVDQDRAAAVMMIDGMPSWIVIVPVLAPDPVAFVGAALPLDEGFLRRINALGTLPLSIGFVVAGQDKQWHVAGGTAGRLLVGLPLPSAAMPTEATLTALPDGETIVLAIPLQTLPGTPAVVITLGYRLSDALWRYRPLAAVLLAVLVLGLVAAVIAATLIARGVSRPIEVLARHAARIGAGNYSPPPSSSRRDEIGQLGAALTHMVGAIAERENHIRHQASHDRVTGLPNRQALSQTLDHCLARPNGEGAAVMMVTLLRLQDIVNTVGRDVADRVMADAARRLARLAAGDMGLTGPGSSMTLGCVGERSFALLFEDVGATTAGPLALRIVELLDRPYQEAGLSVDAGVAVGVVLVNKPFSPAATLLRQAEVAQGFAANTAARWAVYCSDTDPHRPERLSLMSELRQGIPRGEFELLYQAKLDLKRGRITGAEALTRWNHPHRGLVRPDEFIGLAEETGNIGALTRWALEAGITQAARWLECGTPLQVSINLSARDLEDDALPDLVLDLLRHSRLPPALLTLEITENAVMNEPEAAISVLRRLAAYEITLSIDDFGAGRSSLTYLRRLPVRELKIDKAFGLKLANSPEDKTIVDAVVSLGHSFGCSVVAEGIEDAESLALLEGFGCDYAQGYHVARPMQPARLNDLLRRWNGFPLARSRMPAPP